MKSVKSGMSRDFQKRYAPGPSLKRSFDNNNNNNNSSGNNDSKGDLRVKIYYFIAFLFFSFLF